jgi:hypothetical protein
MSGRTEVEPQRHRDTEVKERKSKPPRHEDTKQEVDFE